jgi:HK97 family phage prohead protease
MTPLCPKVQHSTMGDALLEMRRLYEQDLRSGGNRPGGTLGVYRCRHCGYYHVGNTYAHSNTKGTKTMPLALAGVETKQFDCEIKSLRDNEFDAYFAAFNNIDRGGDVIEPGAFKNLDQFKRDGWVGLNHDMVKLPIGYPIEIVQDTKGLRVTGQFHTTPEAQSARTVIRERMAAGKSVKGSIGYKTGETRNEWRNGRNVRVIKSMDLYECSFVNLPMNEKADFMSVKSRGQKIMTLADLKAWLDLQIKAGRVLSRVNRAKLCDWHERITGMAQQIKEFLDSLDDEGRGLGEEDLPDSEPGVGVESNRAIELRRAGSPPPPDDPRRAGGNTLVGQGAATAESLRQRAKSIWNRVQLVDTALRCKFAFAEQAALERYVARPDVPRQVKEMLACNSQQQWLAERKAAAAARALPRR